MRLHGLFWLPLALVLASASSAAGGASMSDEPLPYPEDPEIEEIYEPSAGAIVGAIAINLVYVPVRFVVTVIGAGLGGIEGLISAGNVDAAHDIWGLTNGSQIITPAMLEGREQWTFSGYGW